jgi:nitrite reductase/ring-hydroxylating ferredoxin subunit
VPFQLAGAGALAILVTMAATSHDFWLAHLSPGTWKRLHMLVYPAYGLLILHVAFGALQAEPHPLYLMATGAGLLLVLGLHVAAAIRERRVDLAPEPKPQPPEGMVPIGPVAGIPLNRARIIRLNGERVAIFRHARGLSAVSNVCQHQNGPLGEGRIIDGCITCPWHGYQYLPESGASPPPFTEKVATFRVAVVEGQVWIDPNPNPPGTPVPPAPIPESCTSQP